MFSYGELFAIEEAWTEYAAQYGHEPENAFDFIDVICSEVYPSEEEQEAIYNLISCIEEAC